MIENLPSRLSMARGRDPEWFAKLSARAWTVPTIDPFTYLDVYQFKGVVGRITKTGFDPCFEEQEIAFLSGLCAGVFFMCEVVPVVRWPFLTQANGHLFKWAAKGCGQITAWTQKVAGKWRIDDAPTINGGVFPPHYIETGGQITDPFTTYPGMPFPYAKTTGTLDNRPVQFKWLGAEGKFCPIVQAPPT